MKRAHCRDGRVNLRGRKVLAVVNGRRPQLLDVITHTQGDYWIVANRLGHRFLVNQRDMVDSETGQLLHELAKDADA